MPTNFYWFFITALIPIAVGFVYYHPAVFGKAWMRVNHFTEKDLEGGNMAVILGISYLLGLILSWFMTSVVIHQGGAFSMMVPEVLESGSDVQNQFNDLMRQYGDRYRNFQHGAIHGVMAALMIFLPLFAMNAMFEKRGWKYIWIHTGYAALVLALIGGILCAMVEYAPMS